MARLPNHHVLPTVRLTTLCGLLALASNIRGRLQSLTVLQKGFDRWPIDSVELMGMAPFEELEDSGNLVGEETLAKYCAQTFFEVTGRAPVLPHMFPTS